MMLIRMLSFLCLPSKNTFSRESDTFRISAENPGVMNESLDIFASSKCKGKSCKISIDGKKLAYGFGKKNLVTKTSVDLRLNPDSKRDRTDLIRNYQPLKVLSRP